MATTTNERKAAFLKEIAAVSKRHGLALSHEDDQGAFIVEEYDASLIEWLSDASTGQTLKPQGGKK